MVGKKERGSGGEGTGRRRGEMRGVRRLRKEKSA